MDRKGQIIVLNIFMALFSLGSVCSKLAGKYEYLSVQFCFFYGMALFLMFIYAIAWQQIIKNLNLTIAYANRAMTVLWGCVWGRIFFNEVISLKLFLGGLLVMVGVVIYSLDMKGEKGA